MWKASLVREPVSSAVAKILPLPVSTATVRIISRFITSGSGGSVSEACEIPHLGFDLPDSILLNIHPIRTSHMFLVPLP